MSGLVGSEVRDLLDTFGESRSTSCSRYRASVLHVINTMA